MKNNLILPITLALALLVSAILSSTIAHKLSQNPCLQTRAGLDVGSGSTKFLVAKVDVCSHKMVEILAEESEKIDFQSDLNRSTNNTLSQEIMMKALFVVKRFKAIADSKGASRTTGYATEAFRKAENGQDVISTISNESGVKIEIITQEQEGLIGKKAVSAVLQKSSSRIAVWDIGGGSQEFSVTSARGKDVGFESKLASVSFRDMIIEKIKNLDLSTNKSPNPMTLSQMSDAVGLSSQIAAQVDDSIKQALTQPNLEVVGIGGVHWNSVREQTGANATYSIEDVKRALESRVGKRDEDLNSKYADTQVSNLALVLGHMKELGIQKVRPLKVNLAVGAVVAE